MPAEKRPPEPQNDEAPSQSPPKRRRDDVVVEPQADGGQQDEQSHLPHDQTPPPPPPLQLQEVQHHHDVVSDDDSDASDTGEDPQQEFAYVDLQTIRKEVQCPICLGIIKKTRTVMECLHRFCRECIDKSMRMGNNECPACRTHCASRRSLRDDPRYDAIIAALYPDIKKFEEEELAFCEEDDNRNKQIQESIAEVLRKQSEALGKKRSANKDAAGPSATRSQRNHSRGRRRRRRNGSADYQDSDDNNDDGNGSDKNFAPDEYHTEIKQRKGKSRASNGSSNSPSATNLSGGSFENNLEQSKEGRGLSPGLTCSAEMLAWGRGGVRSNIRHSNINGGMSRSAQRLRLAKLVDFLRNLEENDDEYVDLQPPPLKTENVQFLATRDANGSNNHQSKFHTSSYSNSDKLCQDRLHMLNREETLSGTSCIPNGEQLDVSSFF